MFNLLKNQSILCSVDTKLPLIQVLVKPVNDRFYEVLVKDNGPGIDDSIVDDIFKPYVTNKLTGLGMGLSISKQSLRVTGSPTPGGHREAGCCFRLPCYATTG